MSGREKRMFEKEKLLNEIDHYFDSVTPDEFDAALKKAGYESIEPSSKSGHTMAEPKEVN